MSMENYARTFGIAYTNEPKELKATTLDDSVVVTNARIELPS